MNVYACSIKKPVIMIEAGLLRSGLKWLADPKQVYAFASSPSVPSTISRGAARTGVIFQASLQ
jgi:hypothetical protein